MDGPRSINRRHPPATGGRRVAAPVAAALATLLLAAAFAAAYEDGAPPGYTGGFGEPSCHHCHADNPANDPSGRLLVEGLPASYVGGRRYELAIRLRQEDLRSGGLQLSVRHADGRQAGSFELGNAMLQTVSQDGITYVVHSHSSHARPPQHRETDDNVRVWRLAWNAPESGTVMLHLAANAANDDASALGDYVFTLERTVTTAPRPAP